MAFKEKSTIRQLASEVMDLNYKLEIHYNGGGYFVSITDIETGYVAIISSGDILKAVNDCFERMEELKNSLIRKEITEK